IEAACVAGLVIGVLLVWRLRIDGPAHRFPSFGAGDLFGLFLPAYSYEAERLRGLELPFWNPYQAGGQPFLATLQPGALYPARALLLVTDAATAMQWSTIAHVLLSCLATYALCRARGAVRAGRRHAPGARGPAGARPLRATAPPDALLDGGDGSPAGPTDGRTDHALLGPLAHVVGRLAGRAADLRRLGRAPATIPL